MEALSKSPMVSFEIPIKWSVPDHGLLNNDEEPKFQYEHILKVTTV